MNKKKLIAYIRLERPQFSIISFLAACAGMMAAYKGIPDIGSLLGVGFLFWFLNNVAHPTNDYFDREIDKYARPDAPIPSGDLSPEEAKKDMILHYIIAPPLIILIAKALPVETIPLMIVAFFGLALTAIYSVPPIRTKKRGILKNITTTLALPIVFFGGWVAVRGWSISIEPLILVSVIFFLIISESLLADIHDMIGEKRVGCRTLPVRIGIKNTSNLSFFMGILSVLVIPIPIIMGWLNRYYTVLGAFVMFWIIFLLLKYRINFDPEKGRGYHQKLLIGAPLYIIA
ncbi:MAG TPA: hypothetical protein ENI50_02370, partial [Euryarchaeota archaeon]|nr:hypothetical protein [Euryarchaeota archaeon]